MDLVPTSFDAEHFLCSCVRPKIKGWLYVRWGNMTLMNPNPYDEAKRKQYIFFETYFFFILATCVIIPMNTKSTVDGTYDDVTWSWWVKVYMMRQNLNNESFFQTEIWCWVFFKFLPNSGKSLFIETWLSYNTNDAAKFDHSQLF